MEIQELSKMLASDYVAPANEIKKMQSERLHKLVDYAREHSPFYNELYSNIPEDYSLEDLPISTKQSLMEDYNRWPTDPEVTYDVVMQYLKEVGDDPLKKLLGKYTAIATSGTTGNRTPMVRDMQHNTIHNAMVVQRLLASVAGNPRFQGELRNASILYCDPNASAYGGYLRQKKLTGAGDDRLKAFSILDPINKLCEELDVFKPDILSGYPSAMADIAIEQLNGNIDIHPIGVACSAETVSDSHVEGMRKAWGDDLVILNNYCSTEGGEIAMSCRYGHLHVNEDWIIVEPMDEKGNILRSEELTPDFVADSVLITDLSNFVQPVIRYKVEDHVTWHNEGCKCGNPRPWIVIQGRHGGFDFAFQGKKINTIALYAMQDDMKELVNYQFIKMSETEMQLRVATVPEEKHDALMEEYARRVREYIEPMFHGTVKVTTCNDGTLPNKRGGKRLSYVCKEMVM